LLETSSSLLIDLDETISLTNEKKIENFSDFIQLRVCGFGQYYFSGSVWVFWFFSVLFCFLRLQKVIGKTFKMKVFERCIYRFLSTA